MDCYFYDTNQYYTYAFITGLLISFAGNMVACAKYCSTCGRNSSVMSRTIEKPFMESDIETTSINIETVDQGVNTLPQAKEKEIQMVSPTTARHRRYNSVWNNDNQRGIPSWAVNEYISTSRD